MAFVVGGVWLHPWLAAGVSVQKESSRAMGPAVGGTDALAFRAERIRQCRHELQNAGLEPGAELDKCVYTLAMISLRKMTGGRWGLMKQLSARDVRLRKAGRRWWRRGARAKRRASGSAPRGAAH